MTKFRLNEAGERPNLIESISGLVFVTEQSANLGFSAGQFSLNGYPLSTHLPRRKFFARYLNFSELPDIITTSPVIFGGSHEIYGIYSVI